MRATSWRNAAVIMAVIGITVGQIEGSRVVFGADEFERPPIEYSKSTPSNCITQLQEKLEKGEAKLEYTSSHGYLPSVLKALKVPVESQSLVFSKTSLQLRRISPTTPRAIYFNDEVYIGFCQAGDVLEVSASDPQLGTVFYTLNQEEVDVPQFDRRTDNCLVCHSSSRTEGVPGHLVRSLFVDVEGQAIFSAGSRTVDYTTPIDQRWGGWYVTGKHGSQTHLGNLIIRGRNVPRNVDNAQGQNVVELADRFKIDKYLIPHSDLIALMVLEHQTLMHNRLTRANFATRQALEYEATLNRGLANKTEERFESTTRRIQSAGDDLVEALLFVGEAELKEPVSGTSGFTEAFPKSGARDAQGRSLRDLDLSRRLFRYPLSYLIYSPSFDGLPKEMKEYVWSRLWKVLSGEDRASKFAHLSPDDRRAIIEIVGQTKPDRPDYWKL